LGPIFSSFGRYMSARADLWPAKDCLELANISDHAEATPPDLVISLLSQEIACRVGEAPFTFEEKPFESRLLFQSHYACLNDGTDLIVKIVHPETEEQLLYDLDLLPLLKGAFAACGVSDHAFKNASADFCHTLQQQTDLSHEARAFETLAQDAEDYDALLSPQVCASLSTSKVLVTEKLKGLRLNEVMTSVANGDDDGTRPLLGSEGLERNELARLLCEVWLRQALLGRNFPVAPSPENILVLPSKQIVFSGGAFAGLPAEPQANLWDYLVAAANDNSDKACFCLLKEMRKEAASVRDNVQQRFRQAMPFRDGGWDASGDRRSLAELLFVHWRFASECGYVPQMHLPAFYRGLFSIADAARRIAPTIDPLAEGLRNLRLIAGLEQFTRMMSRRRLSEQLEGHAGLMMDLPQTLDDALTSLAEGHTRLKLQSANSTAHGGADSSSSVVVALVLLLAGVVLLSQYITPSIVGGAWANRINTIVFMVIGGLLLRVVSRTG
jgi:predicted unusual protein kinase regulating ubiquinone biosynthesis (AarF/ABC1/UbiB family)